MGRKLQIKAMVVRCSLLMSLLFLIVHFIFFEAVLSNLSYALIWLVLLGVLYAFSKKDCP